MPSNWVIGLDGEGRIARLEGASWNGKAVARPSLPGDFLLKSLAKTRLVVDTKLKAEAGGRRRRQNVIGHQICLELVVDTGLIREPPRQ
jgi:hypothetical protein